MDNKKHEFGFGTKTILSTFINMKIAHYEEPEIQMPGRPPDIDRYVISLYLSLTNMRLKDIANKFRKNVKLVSRWNTENRASNLHRKLQEEFVEFLMMHLRTILSRSNAPRLIFETQEDWNQVRNSDADFYKGVDPIILESIKEFADSYIYHLRIFDLFLTKIFQDDPEYGFSYFEWLPLTKIVSKIFYGQIDVQRECFKKLADIEFRKIIESVTIPNEKQWAEIKTSILFLDELLNEI